MLMPKTVIATCAVTKGKIMKLKLTVPKRNPFVCLVLRKTGAGSHRKPNKAVRKQERQQGYNLNG